MYICSDLSTKFSPPSPTNSHSPIPQPPTPRPIHPSIHRSTHVAFMMWLRCHCFAVAGSKQCSNRVIV